MSQHIFAIVTAHNEAESLGATLAALADTFPGVLVWVADDGSTDASAQIAAAAGAEVVRSERVIGKGAAASAAARVVLGDPRLDEHTLVLLCDGDLGSSAARLGPLVEVVRRGDADMTVAVFAQRVGGGVGLAVGFARWAIARRCGLSLRAPISGQRVLSARALARAAPFEKGFGMEIGMTIDVARAGFRIEEVELELEHRATGKTLSGFLHRGRQLVDFVRVYRARR
ncbi:MAG TPA: glycosyltransferase [Solirubrobacteraceae bacterium]|nr:glycosyltransferase [Solirubrobacteraceae bacterium]